MIFFYKKKSRFVALSNQQFLMNSIKFYVYAYFFVMFINMKVSFHLNLKTDHYTSICIQNLKKTQVTLQLLVLMVNTGCIEYFWIFLHWGRMFMLCTICI